MALVYAHRGGAALRPENTIAAFDHGLSLGADGLEFDVHLSSDNVVVIHHDDTLERMTKGRGMVCSHTAQQLAALDVPTLGEVLARYPAIPLIIELKVDGEALVRGVIAELRRAGALNRASLGSFHSRALLRARELEPSVRTGASRQETRRALFRSWIGRSPGVVPYRELQVPERSGLTRVVSRRFIRHAHAAGVPVKVWTVNDPDDMRRLIAWGVDGLITDRPDLAVPLARASR
jgi:glycerophosphoryl diester phosphodiesterase